MVCGVERCLVHWDYIGRVLEDTEETSKERFD